ncbi:hypothetical protein ACQPYK_44405 [Streptosporangium sp. CA-135522]|uniref:hypothetical protein n=1 Tax=Streptosporangium sp. CA-135522 TaxID=3240072 RepID=UPI003D8D0E8A
MEHLIHFSISAKQVADREFERFCGKQRSRPLLDSPDRGHAMDDQEIPRLAPGSAS